MAKLTGDIIKTGLHIWVSGWASGDSKYKDIPVELVIIDTTIRDRVFIPVAIVTPNASSMSVFNSCKGYLELCLSDDGVRPFNYDQRSTQVFTTKEECEAAIAMWDGRNPNCLTEDGEDIQRHSFVFDDLYGLDD